MTSSQGRLATIAAAMLAVSFTLVASDALAQATRTSRETAMRTLGGRTRFSTPVRSVDAVHRMATRNRADLTRLLSAAGLGSISDQVLTTLTTGTMVETSVSPGTRMEWMAYRRNGRAGLLRNVRWAGAKPFEAYEFTIDSGGTRYTFVVPKDCSNLALVNSAAVPASPSPTPGPGAGAGGAAPTTPSGGAPGAGTTKPTPGAPGAGAPGAGAPGAGAPGAGATGAGAPGAGTTKPSVPTTPAAPGVGAGGGQPGAGAPGAAGAGAGAGRGGAGGGVGGGPGAGAAGGPTGGGSQGGGMGAGGLNPFIMGAFGKERRQRELTNGIFGGFCDPLFGVKGGLQFEPRSNFVIAPAVGVAVNLDEGDRTSLFADLELNYVFGSAAYIGTGLGVWDFNHGDNVTPNLLLHFGVPITRYDDSRSRALFVGEGRLFFDNIDEVDNNYQFWAGLRYIFR